MRAHLLLAVSAFLETHESGLAFVQSGLRALTTQGAVRTQSTCPLSTRPTLGPLYGKGKFNNDILGVEEEEGTAEEKSAKAAAKEKIKLEPEVTHFEGAPDISETFVPGISILTVIGLIPFAASVARQLWVRYKITSRRISVVSGIGGKDETEVVYQDIKKMLFVYRFFGRCGDLVLELRDGSKLEMRSLPNFEDNYSYILNKTSAACKEASQKLTAKKE